MKDCSPTRGEHADLRAQPLLLFADRGCPFTHRVLALLAHLQVSVDRRESAVGHSPEGVALYSATKRIPLLSHGTLALSESRIMLDYLAELYEYSGAYPPSLVTRTRHKHAMALIDNDLAPLVFASQSSLEGNPRLMELLGVVEAATATAPLGPNPCLLALHFAPIWRAALLLQPNGVLCCSIRACGALHQWLQAAVELDCVVRTAYDQVALKSELAAARAAGLLGPQSH